MAIIKKPYLNQKEIEKVIKKGGSTISSKSDKDVIHVSLQFSYQLNNVIESLQKNQFGIKRTKKQWVMEAIFAKIKEETGEEYKEV